jgi:hypothetical protein
MKLKTFRVKSVFPDGRRRPLGYEPGGDRAIISNNPGIVVNFKYT